MKEKIPSSKDRQSEILRAVLSIKSVEELDKLVGEITPAEQQMLDEVDSIKHPYTKAEKEALGPNFTKELIERMHESHPGE